MTMLLSCFLVYADLLVTYGKTQNYFIVIVSYIAIQDKTVKILSSKTDRFDEHFLA